MNNWYNESGKELSSEEWLESHHRAKILERKKFIKMIIKDNDETIIDLGCGYGFWLEIINEYCDKTKTLYGVDIDSSAITRAKQRLKNAKCNVHFITCDMEQEIEKIPNANLILLLNMSCYIKDFSIFLEKIKKKLLPGGRLIIKQYDGSLLRIGPMCEKTRKIVDNSLYYSLSSSNEFYHYDIDRVYESVINSSFSSKVIKIDTYFKKAPYGDKEIKYIKGHIEWVKKYISEAAKIEFEQWIKDSFLKKSYYLETDFVFILS